MAVPTIVNLDQFETRELFTLETRVPGTYLAKMMIRGNSLLSSVFIKAIDPGATLQVNYYDTSTGSDDLFERYDLQCHPLLAGPNVGETSRILVTRIHNKPQTEIIVTGGNVEFGIYITVVSDFAQELVTPGNGGFESAEGIAKQIRFSGVTDQALEVAMISVTVPVAETWRLRSVSVHTRPYGVSKLIVAGVEAARIISSPINENGTFPFAPYFEALTGQIIELKYTQSHGPVSDITAFLQYTIN